MNQPLEKDEVYLSERLIREWMEQYVTLNAERVSLIAQVSVLQTKIDELLPIIQNLNNQLRAAIPFSPKVAEWLEEQEDNSPDSAALTDAILKTLLRVTNPTVALQRTTLQSTVTLHGYPVHKLQANPNYLYIALKRLMGRGLIVEEPDHHFRLTEAGRSEAEQKK
jgi:hypothetical protein